MADPIYALFDANSFYAACEKVFRPDLAGKPVVVLSSNDGCVIARSAEAKALGIKMGAPYFQIRRDLERWGVAAFSSNFALYGDMSARFMAVIESMVDGTERYSVDELFADLGGMPDDLEALGRRVRREVLQRTGITVGVGISTTKTLAKLANHAAKKWQRQTGGVVDLRDPVRRDKLLRATVVEDVWGIGRRMTENLQRMGIHTAWDLAIADAATLRKQFSVVIERTARELRGIPCLALDEAPVPKKEICCSRSFGQKIHSQPQLAEAVASYVARAAEKLRRQHSLCRHLRVGIRTSLFDQTAPQYGNGAQIVLPYPTDDTRVLTAAALRGLAGIYRDGFAYSKAEVLLMDFCRRDQYTPDLFAPCQPGAADKLMSVMDQVNARWGRGTLRPGRVPAEPGWGMRRELMSQSYTTRLDQLWTVRCR